MVIYIKKVTVHPLPTSILKGRSVQSELTDVYSALVGLLHEHVFVCVFTFSPSGVGAPPSLLPVRTAVHVGPYRLLLAGIAAIMLRVIPIKKQVRVHVLTVPAPR